MIIDLRTLAIVLTLTNLLQVIALFAQYRLDKTHVGPGWWTAGTALVALGFSCTSIQDNPVIGSLAIVAASALFSSGMALFYIGLLRFLGLQERPWPLIVFCTAVTLVAAWFTYVDVDVAARLVNLSAAIAVLSFLNAYAIFANRTPSLATSAYSLALVFLVQGVTLITIAAVAASSDVEGLYIATLAHTALYLDGLIVSVLLTLYFIIMVNQRLIAESREAKNNVELIFNANPDPIVITRAADGRFIAVNDGFVSHSGYTRADVMGRTTLDTDLWKIPGDRERLIGALQEQGYCDNLETVFLRKDGSEVIGLVSAKLIRQKGVPHIVTVLRDITDRKRAEEAQRRTQELFSLFMHHSPIYIYIKEVTPTTSRVLQASDNFQQILGISAREMVGKTMTDLFPAEFAAAITADDWAVVVNDEVLKRDEDFNGRHYTSIKFPIVQDDRTLLAGYSIDNTERRALEDKLQQQATTDGLTGVANRRHFLDLAQTETRRALRHAHPLALALIDIDRFKQINDVHGHAAGDRALLVLVRICRENIREIDVFARFGGDEFVVLLPETGEAEAGDVIERVRLSLAAEPVDLGGHPVAITISAGVAGLAGAEDSLDALLMRADRALYRAKNAGRNRMMTTFMSEKTPAGCRNPFRT